VEEQRHGQVTNLLLGVFVCRYEVDSFEVAKIDVPAQDVDVEKLREEISTDRERGCRQRRTLQTYFFL